MPLPKSIVCKICGGKFMSQSYPIHVPRCQKKFEASHTKCEHCGRQINNCDWGAHRADCKPAPKARNSRKKRPKKRMVEVKGTCEECEGAPAEFACLECEMCFCKPCSAHIHSKGARKRHTIRDAAGADPNKVRDAVETEDGTMVEREACKVCSRKFAVDRIYIHERICVKKQENAKKIKPKIGSKLRVKGTDFEAYARKRPKTPPEVLEWRKNGRRWRQERGEFKDIVETQNMRMGIEPTEEKLPSSIVEPPKNIILPKKSVDISRRNLLRTMPDANALSVQLQQATTEFQQKPSPVKAPAQESNVVRTREKQQPPAAAADTIEKQRRRERRRPNAAPRQQSRSAVSTLHGSVDISKSRGIPSTRGNRTVKGADGSIKIRSQYQDRALARKRGEDALKRVKQSRKQSSTLPSKQQKRNSGSTTRQTSHKLGGGPAPQDMRAAREAFARRQEQQAQQQRAEKVRAVSAAAVAAAVAAEADEMVYPDRTTLPSKKLTSMDEYLERERLRRASSRQNARGSGGGRNTNVSVAARRPPSKQKKSKPPTTTADDAANGAAVANRRRRPSGRSEKKGGTAFTVDDGGKSSAATAPMPMFSSSSRPKKVLKKPAPGLLGRSKNDRPLTIAERDNPNVGKVPIQRRLKAKLIDGKVQRVLSHTNEVEAARKRPIWDGKAKRTEHYQQQQLQPEDGL